METRNAIITDVVIEIEDHGFLTAWVTLDYGGSGQGFGGYVLHNATRGRSFAGRFLYRVLETVGVHRWDDLIGKTVRVQQDNGKVHAIGHIVHDAWFNPSEEFK